MKIRYSSEQGSTVIMCLIIASIMGMVLASYLSLVSAQNLSVTRSQTWNSVVPVAEAGAEEALTHLYHNGPSNLFLCGWITAGSDYYKWRQVGDGWAYL
ncbi:MAG: hypothetical protein AB1705_22850, partial [Verrucomicrobiota bacterium]